SSPCASSASGGARPSPRKRDPRRVCRRAATTTTNRGVTSCCSSARRAWARPQSRSPSPAPWGGRTSAFRSAPLRTRPTSGPIPGPLVDRMDLVSFAGYTEREKLEIAKRYLVPRQLRQNGLTGEQLQLTDEALSEMIASYTREAGVRQLEREIGKLARKVAHRIAAGEAERISVTAEGVHDLIGRPKVHAEPKAGEGQIGVATGMYYTPVGRATRS